MPLPPAKGARCSAHAGGACEVTLGQDWPQFDFVDQNLCVCYDGGPLKGESSCAAATTKKGWVEKKS